MWQDIFLKKLYEKFHKKAVPQNLLNISILFKSKEIEYVIIETYSSLSCRTIIFVNEACYTEWW